MKSARDIVLKIVCPVLGAIMANIMFFAPFKDARRAVASANLGDLNPTPWAIMTGNCIGWITYAFLTSDLYIFFANFPGLILSVWLNLIATKLTFENHRTSEIRKSFSHYLERETSRRQSIPIVTTDTETENSIVQQSMDFGKMVWDVTSQTSPAPTLHENLVVAMVTIWLILISIISIAHGLDKKTDQFIVGLAVNLNLVFFYGAPLSTIWKVLSSRNSVSIHIPTMAANTANGVFWAAYGIAVTDPFIIVPNSMGAGLGVIQFILIMLFPRTTQSEPQTATPDNCATEEQCNNMLTETESGRTSPTVPTGSADQQKSS